MKKVLLSLVAVGAAIAMLPMFAAFEAHVVNVTAKIENALSVTPYSIDFGTVFPQEQLDRFIDVQLSQSFRDEKRVDDVDYFIRQKPKCGLPQYDAQQNIIGYLAYGVVTEGENGQFVCVDAREGYVQLPLLCPYLSKHEVTEDGRETNNDKDIAAFHGPIENSAWTLAVAKLYEAKGRLIKAAGDLADQWKIDLKVPCFGGYCAQDWQDYVFGINPEAVAANYVQPIANEHKLFGCDLWIEVSGISLPGIGCNKEADVALVLDRSGSIDSGELATLKTAAKAFVSALAPSTNGVHMGQSSFATNATLDQQLTDSAALMNAAIDALVNDGLTFLSGGIDLADDELESERDRADGPSPDVMVIITDGNPNLPGGVDAAKLAATAEADEAKGKGVTVFVVGVGSDVDAAYLQTIATSPAHYYTAANYADLQAVLLLLTQCDED